MEKFQGSCLCGAVRFEIKGDPKAFFFCHCSRCRKKTGSAHGANVFSSNEETHWISGKDFVKTYRLPESRFTSSFCTECGSALPTVGKAGALIPAGSLDMDVNFKPTGHIFWESRANWDENLEKVEKFTELPPTF